jgi:hypothetical protein
MKALKFWGSALNDLAPSRKRHGAKRATNSHKVQNGQEPTD